MAENEPIRLLVVGMKWPPETFLARMLGGLARRGFEVTIAGPDRPRDAAFHQSGFRWVRSPSRKPPRLSRLLRTVTAATVGARAGTAHAERGRSHAAGAGRITRFARSAGQRWDLIYFPWNSAAIEMLPLFDSGIPAVVSCRGSQIKIAPHNPDREVLREGLETTFQRAAFVHCVSQDILEDAQAYGLDPTMAHVIRPAIDTAFFRPREEDATASGGPLRIITTGSLIWCKGHEFALSAIRRLKDRGIPARFTIIGDGAEKQRVLYTMYDLGIDDSVDLIGRLPPDQVRDRLREADVFLLSSLSEGISNAALEAMACGLPVVTTDCGGMREAIEDGVEGFVVPVRDPGAIADALARLAENPESRRSMGQAARRRAVREFDLEHQIERWAELCHQTVARWREGQ